MHKAAPFAHDSTSSFSLCADEIILCAMLKTPSPSQSSVT
jgi:hypothetical protein